MKDLNSLGDDTHACLELELLIFQNMLILLSKPPIVTPVHGPLSPLNAVWFGELHARQILPQFGHLLLVFPAGEEAVHCAGVTIEASRYLLLAPASHYEPVSLEVLSPQAGRTQLLVLWISPPFIFEMAGFLGIPRTLQQLVHGIPLLQGDPMSLAVAELAEAYRHTLPPDYTEDLFLEVVGEVLRLMRMRQDALQRLAHHRPGTIDDLLPRLLQVRQFVEASFTETIKMSDAASRIGLSEYHFARLYKTAFDVTLRQHLIRLRLDAARRVLHQPEATVTATAFQVGYISLSSFIHAFTRRFGLSPARYQAQVKRSQDSTSQPAQDFLY